METLAVDRFTDILYDVADGVARIINRVRDQDDRLSSCLKN